VDRKWGALRSHGKTPESCGSDDLLSFSRLDRKQIRKEMFNMIQLVGEVIGKLEPIRGSRNIEFKIGPPACLCG